MNKLKIVYAPIEQQENNIEDKGILIQLMQQFIIIGLRTKKENTK